MLIAILILLPVFAMNLMIDANEPVVKGLIRCVLVVMSIDVILVVLNKYARESPYVYISLFICIMSTYISKYFFNRWIKILEFSGNIWYNCIKS